MSSQTYTLTNLCEDCASRGKQLLHDQQVGKQTALTMTLSQISHSETMKVGKAETYQQAFRVVTEELSEAASTLVPLIIPNFGTFGYRLFNLGISIPFFDLHPKYANAHSLVRPSTSSKTSSSSKAAPQRLNMQRCAKQCRLPQALFKDVLMCLWRRLGRVMRSNAVVRK
jgi:hypothetical protein